MTAFTLVETMVAAGVGVTMLGMATLVMVDLYKDFAAASAYCRVHEQARRSMAFMSRDLRATSNVVAFSTTDLQLAVLNATGGVSTVRYRLVNQNLQRTSVSGSSVTTTNLLTDDVTSVVFERWTKPGTLAISTTNTFEIRAYITITNSSSFRVASDLLQTRIRLRNKF